MELDDLKKQWKSTPTNQSTDAIKDAIEKKISGMERSGRGIARTFWIEMFFSWLIYVIFLMIMWLYRDLIETYMYKITILIGVSMIPIVWRLYKSMKWAQSIDYSQDVRTNIIAFLKYFKRTLLIYEVGCYVIVAISFAVIYTDQSFLAAKLKVQTIIFLYLMLVAVIARPYVYLVYGKKVKAFEEFLKD